MLKYPVELLYNFTKKYEEEDTFISLGWLLQFFLNKNWYP